MHRSELNDCVLWRPRMQDVPRVHFFSFLFSVPLSPAQLPIYHQSSYKALDEWLAET